LLIATNVVVKANKSGLQRLPQELPILVGRPFDTLFAQFHFNVVELSVGDRRHFTGVGSDGQEQIN
jgi:hypothetical protein